VVGINQCRTLPAGNEATTKCQGLLKQALILNNAYPPALLEMQKLSYQAVTYWQQKATYKDT